MSDYEVDQEDDMVGYISIKDYAYDESNPLHFGYFEEDEEDQNNLRLSGNRESVLLPDEYIVNKRAIAMYAFVPENDNELELKEGDVVYISYKHGQGWLVAENHDRSKTGLVPEEYVQLIEDDDEDNGGYENPRPFYLTQMITQSMSNHHDDDWEDIEDDEEAEVHSDKEHRSIQRRSQDSVSADITDNNGVSHDNRTVLENGKTSSTSNERSEVSELAKDIKKKLDL
ncbi:Nbp2 [Kluyveromyces lactis]|nr:Nbp2 [Kluyveromyces lactis]